MAIDTSSACHRWTWYPLLLPLVVLLGCFFPKPSLSPSKIEVMMTGISSAHGRLHRESVVNKESAESRRPLTNVEWLHITKTGTSFGNTLVLWACPELDPEVVWVHAGGVRAPATCLAKFRPEPLARKGWPIGDHISVANRSEAELRNVVTMVRWPPAIVASWYFYFKQQNKRTPGNVTEEAICQAAQSTKVLYIMGWMIAGKHDSKGNPVSDEVMVKNACHRLSLFAFVGVTDFWDASVCLFHAMHGGVTRSIESVNVRESKRWQHNEPVQHVSCGQNGEGTPDDGVFRCGLGIFLDRLKRYPHCQRQLPDPAQVLWSALGNG